MKKAIKKPRVLCVDDEPEILAGIRRAVYREFEVSAATSGREALALLAQGPSFVAVVADMRMPGMDGVTFLGKARQLAPDSVRILLTGHADLETAINAVNEGFIFRLLRKPCPADVLNTALVHARVQYRLVTQDRELLEKRLAAMSNQLLHAERLATLGTLSRGVGHELGNITTVLHCARVELNRSLAAGTVPSEQELALLERVEAHLRLHCRHLMELGRPTSQRLDKTDLRAIVADTVDMLQVAGRLKHIPTLLDLPSEEIPIEVDRTRIEQVLVNLLGNAADALQQTEPPKRQIKICLSQVTGNGHVRCQIADTGCGISNDQIETIFEPYFTTKEEGKGTGLGLPVVKQIIEQYKGSLSVESQLGAGTTFSFLLPLANNAAASA